MIPKEEHCKCCGEWLPDDVDICPQWSASGAVFLSSKLKT